MTRIFGLIFLLTGASVSLSFQDPPKNVRLQVQWIDTSLDLWEELRQVDPAFNGLADEVARLTKGLEADEIESRSKAATQLKALGLTAYGPIKALRAKTTSAEVRSQLDGVLKSLAAGFDPALATIPGARSIGAVEYQSLLDRLKDKRVSRQMPALVLVDGQRANI